MDLRDYSIERKQVLFWRENCTHRLDMVGNTAPYRVKPQADGFHLRNVDIFGCRNVMVGKIVIGY